MLDLQKFREKPLDEQAIYNIKTILYLFASHKKDVILRPVYDREGKGLEAEPESFELVLTHLIHIGEVLENTYHRQDSCGSADTGTVAYFDPGREISETGMEGFRSV